MLKTKHTGDSPYAVVLRHIAALILHLAGGCADLCRGNVCGLDQTAGFG